MIRIDVKDATNTLTSAFSALTDKQIGRAASKSLNDAIKQVRTQTKRMVTSAYNFKSQYLKNTQMPIERATPISLEATLGMSKKPIPMRELKGRPKQTDEGVRVQIRKGRNIVLPSAFLLEGSGRNVFGRAFVTSGSAYTGGQFAYRNKRIESSGSDTPLGLFVTASPIGAVRNSGQLDTLADLATQAYTRRLDYHLNAILSKAK